MNERSRELLAHLALALSRYEREAGRDGVAVPPELGVLRVFLTDCAQRRPEATEGAGGALLTDGGGMTEHVLLLSRRQVAGALGCSSRTVDRLIAAGTLAAVKVEGSTKVRRGDLDAYIAGLSPGSFRERVNQKGTAC